MSKRGRQERPASQLDDGSQARWDHHTRRLFVRSLDDLRARCDLEQADWFETLGAAGLIRALLIDKRPLFDLANRRERLAIHFFARPMHHSQMQRASPGVRLLNHGDCLDPRVPCGNSDEPIKLTRDGWLKHQVGVFDGRTVTVREYVLAVAHSLGAVHRDVPGELEAQLLALLVHPDPRIEGLVWQQGVLRAIGRVTEAGLRPLAARLVEKRDGD